jgi:hypothetical protein
MGGLAAGPPSPPRSGTAVALRDCPLYASAGALAKTSPLKIHTLTPMVP